MIFEGIEDYYLWMAIAEAQIAPGSDLEGLLLDVGTQGTELDIRCQEAYIWGFYIGSQLTAMEYHDMVGFGTVECDKNTTTIVTDEGPSASEVATIIDELNNEFPVKGNC